MGTTLFIECKEQAKMSTHQESAPLTRPIPYDFLSLSYGKSISPRASQWFEWFARTTDKGKEKQMMVKHRHLHVRTESCV